MVDYSNMEAVQAATRVSFESEEMAREAKAASKDERGRHQELDGQTLPGFPRSIVGCTSEIN